MVRLTSTQRATAASWRVWPWVNDRRKDPSVEGAYTAANIRVIRPWRITSRSSIQSAPAAMPATIEVILAAGLAPVEAIGGSVIFTCLLTRSDNPACSARVITGASPAQDTRLSSSNETVAVDQLCHNLTEGVFLDLRYKSLSNSHY